MKSFMLALAGALPFASFGVVAVDETIVGETSGNSDKPELLIVAKLQKGQVCEAVGLAIPYCRRMNEKLASQSTECRFWDPGFFWKSDIPAALRFEFYKLLFEQFPDLTASRDFIFAAIGCGREAEVGEIISEKLENKSLTPAQMRGHISSHVDYLEMTGRMSEAIAARDGLRDWYGTFYVSDTIKIAALVNDAEAVRINSERLIAGMKPGGEVPYLDNLADAYIATGRAGEVEPMIIGIITNFLSGTENHDYRRGYVVKDPYYAQELLRFYFKQNRMADALVLLGAKPWWGDKRDALDMVLNSHASGLVETGYRKSGMPYMMANIFYETGQIEAAAKITGEIMRNDLSIDWAYDLRLKIAGGDLEKFIAEMDALSACDTLEKRPLIWKAEALRRMKRLEEAEQNARRAIAIDPTDGDQMRGDRVRAQAVLSEILEERGKAEEAKMYKDLVRAVRIAEEGDAFAGHIFTKRSIELYKEAEAVFPDAYCIHWRLAKQFRQQGLIDETRKHFVRAFELMPGQFGRVSSYCEDCMNLFYCPESVSAAGEVLPRLLAEPSPPPATFYLMGQLCEKRGNIAEAAAWYLKALDADPDYLDVMARLVKIKNEINLDDIDWVALQERMFRLTNRDAAGKFLPPPAESIYPLAANIKRIDETPASP